MNEEELAWACRRLPTWQGIPQPLMEEECQDWLDRVCGVLGLSIEELTVAIRNEVFLAGIAISKTRNRLSYSPYWNDEIIARVLGVSRYSLDRLKNRTFPLKHSDGDVRFCPWCWREDTRSGLMATLREEWVATYATMCPAHGLPLCQGSVPFSSEGRSALADRVLNSFPDIDAKTIRILAQLSAFERYSARHEPDMLFVCVDMMKFMLRSSRRLYKQTVGFFMSRDNPILRFCLEAAEQSPLAFLLLGLEPPNAQVMANSFLGDKVGWVHWLRGWIYLSLLILWMIFQKILEPMLKNTNCWDLAAYEAIVTKMRKGDYASLGRFLRGIFSIDDDAFWLPGLAEEDAEGCLKNHRL